MEPNMSGHDPGAQIQVASKSIFQCGSSYIAKDQRRP